MYRIIGNSKFGIWDAFALLIIITMMLGTASLLSQGEALVALVGNSISLSPYYLPYYAMRSVFRMFLALLLSIITTFLLGTWMAKSHRAEKILLPMVDILQSVPVLAFLQVAIWGFGSMMSDPIYAFEVAAILAIYTSQVWNMILAFYQSLKAIPQSWMDMANVYNLSRWRKFWQIEVQFALPELVSNTMMSLSAGWFFVVASEAIMTHGNVTYLPGLGSYIHQASSQQDSVSLYYAMLALFIVILAYDQLIFRPVSYWIYKREHAEYTAPPWPVKMFQRVRWLGAITLYWRIFWDKWLNLFPGNKQIESEQSEKMADLLYYLCLFLLLTFSLSLLFYTLSQVELNEVFLMCIYGCYTALRIFVMIILVSFIWVPLGVYIGKNPKLSRFSQPILQFLAAFPAYIVYPFASHFIQNHNLDPNFWLSPLLIMGTQWYILFNVIVAVQRLPKGMDDTMKLLSATTWIKWRTWILPSIFPMLVIGLNSAAGGAWNASIEAEMITWGDKTISAYGLGSYIRIASDSGQLINMTLATVIMCIFVTFINHFLWMPMIHLAQRRYQIREEE